MSHDVTPSPTAFFVRDFSVTSERYFVTKGGADVMAFVVGGKFSVEEG